MYDDHSYVKKNVIGPNVAVVTKKFDPDRKLTRKDFSTLNIETKGVK